MTDTPGVPSKGPLRGTLFLSASIPDPVRFESQFDALAITDAVVALARAFLTAGWELVTAAHPTIAPLLLYVAAEIPGEKDRRVTTYQSRLFAAVMPAATSRFEADGIGRFVWTEASPDDSPEHGRWDASLAIMRRKMLTDTAPDAGIFVGGMEGISTEFELFGEMLPGKPRYALGAPGGEAAFLAREMADTNLGRSLRDEHVYPTLARRVLEELEPR